MAEKTGDRPRFLTEGNSRWPFGKNVVCPRLIPDRTIHKTLRWAAAHQGLKQDQLAVGVVGDARRDDGPLAPVPVDVARRFVVTRAVGLARSAHRRCDP